MGPWHRVGHLMVVGMMRGLRLRLLRLRGLQRRLLVAAGRVAVLEGGLRLRDPLVEQQVHVVAGGGRAVVPVDDQLLVLVRERRQRPLRQRRRPARVARTREPRGQVGGVGRTALEAQHRE